jgi:hypothetical protein
MGMQLSKLSDLRIFYKTVQYCIDKGGADGMSELAQHYKAIKKLHKIAIPTIERLLDSCSASQSPKSSPKTIRHLELAALKLANKRSEQLTKQFLKKKYPLSAGRKKPDGYKKIFHSF